MFYHILFFIVRNCDYQERVEVLSSTTHPEYRHLTTVTLKFCLAKYPISISHICSHPTGPRHSIPAQQDRTTKSRNQKLLYMTPVRDQSIESNRPIFFQRIYLLESIIWIKSILYINTILLYSVIITKSDWKWHFLFFIN